MQKRYIGLLICAALLIVAASFLLRSSVGASGSPVYVTEASGDELWSEVSEPRLVRADEARPARYRTLKLHNESLESIIAAAPMEESLEALSRQVIMSLPMPDGTFMRFQVEESPIMAPELAAKFPEIKTFIGRGVDEPAMARFDRTPAGFHAMLFTERGTVYIDPASKGDVEHYISYFKRDFRRGNRRMICEVRSADEEQVLDAEVRARIAPQAVDQGNVRRQYRLVVGATGEYTAFHGGSVSLGLAAINTTMNRVNGIYEREVGVRMILVANNDLVVYTNPSTDGYTNNNGFTMLSENQSKMDSIIGSANYDIGHVFSTGGGGVAGLGVVCFNGQKARGVTGSSSPVGDAFDVDYVAHEMGHQFGANHTFNGTTGSCGGGNRNSSTAYEPGSGATIMAYAGICGSENLQSNSDDYFHAVSLQEIISLITGSASCATQVSTGNQQPTVNAGADFSIPAQTPFTLTATGSDADGDSITYCWEQYNLGSASPPNTDDGSRPIFRSFDPVSSPSRTFPKLSDILNNTSSLGESLPTTTRTLNFRVTVRDNRVGGGRTNNDTALVNVVSTAGPFTVTSPNTNVTWSTGTQQTVSWNVANTTASPINAANVNILLSTDGGLTFPITLASGTPNDGSQNITVPNNPTTTARVKVEAAGNIFFDISNANFTISSGGGGGSLFINSFSPTSGGVGTQVTITGDGFTGATSVRFNNTEAQFTVDSATQITATVPTGATSGPIRVTVGSNQVSSATNFTVLPSPRITSFSPASAPVGAQVFIIGANFTGTTAVRFNGVSATFTVQSSTSIIATVPVGATTGPVTVVTPNATVTSTIIFKVAPKITGFQPGTGIPGQNVTILGTSLANPTQVRFGTLNAVVVSSSATQIVATVPNITSNTRVVVTTADGTGTSPFNFILAKQPQITSFTPTSGTFGTVVTISGANLVGCTIRFNGTEATPVTNNGDGTVSVAVPVGATSGFITATNAAGTATSSTQFTLISAITSFSPTSGLPGDTVVLNGSNLSNPTSVRFGTVSAQIVSSTQNSITVIVPTGAGSGRIEVRLGTQTIFTPTPFFVIKPPVISTFTPFSGREGTDVTITGSNVGFATDVKFGGVSVAGITVINNNSVKVKVPAGATTGKISVTNRAGTAQSNSNFTVLP